MRRRRANSASGRGRAWPERQTADTDLSHAGHQPCAHVMSPQRQQTAARPAAAQAQPSAPRRCGQAAGWRSEACRRRAARAGPATVRPRRSVSPPVRCAPHRLRAGRRRLAAARLENLDGCIGARAGRALQHGLQHAVVDAGLVLEVAWRTGRTGRTGRAAAQGCFQLRPAGCMREPCKRTVGVRVACQGGRHAGAALQDVQHLEQTEAAPSRTQREAAGAARCGPRRRFGGTRDAPPGSSTAGTPAARCPGAAAGGQPRRRAQPPPPPRTAPGAARQAARRCGGEGAAGLGGLGADFGRTGGGLGGGGLLT